MPLISREKSSLKGHWRLETVQDMRSSSSNPVSCSETPIKIYGSKEEIRARKSPETVDAPGFAPDASIPVTLYGAVGGIRTLGRLLAVTRFPVVLVMTTSIPLRISMLNSNAQQQASLYQNWARSQYPIFAFPQKRDGAALRLFPFRPYFSCSSAASFRQQQKTSIACCSSSTGGRDGATRMLLSFGSTP